MKNYQRIFFIIFILFSICHFCNQNATAQKITNRGQLSTWTIFNSDKTIGNQFGLRYIPEFRVEKSIFETNFIDAQLSFNGYRIWQGTSFGDIHSEGEIKPYRIWTRYSSPQFELRIGLQKINFGSATLMRPLMWFDRIDPRDPLQITDGVYGALIRYYFLNNANVWLWGLYGNNNTKGLEIFETKENSIEFGGRLQHPLGNGEIAISFHHRKMDLRNG